MALWLPADFPEVESLPEEDISPLLGVEMPGFKPQPQAK